jgi:hypothetical protein
MWRRSDSRCGDVVENMYWGLPSRKLSSDSRCGDVVENMYWGLPSRKLSSVVYCTAATGMRFHCAIVLCENEY